MGFLSTREQASLIVLAGFLAWLLTRKDLRAHVPELLKPLLSPAIWLPFLAMYTHISLEVWIGFQLGFWHEGLATATIIWAVASGGVLLFKSAGEAHENPFFFHATAAATIAPTVFVTFFMNLATLGLLSEVALQLLLFLVSIGSVVGHSRTDREHQRIAQLCDIILLVVVFSWCAYSFLHLYETWDSLDRRLLIEKLVLPMWLTTGLLPFLFAINLYAAYGRAFRIVGSQTTVFRARWRSRMAIALTLLFRARDIAQLQHYWTRKIVDAETLGAARTIVREFKRSLRDRERTVVAEIEELVRYAGVDGTDSEGRRLDRREFRETIKALRWLATCHMGHYRKRERYDHELLSLLRDGFHTRHGLPRDPGIKMKIAKDGQRWFAYRRTVSGWCFAIGAAGPPPGQWEYDGQDPPRGFPGEDPSWGDIPFREDISRNWDWY